MQIQTDGRCADNSTALSPPPPLLLLLLLPLPSHTGRPRVLEMERVVLELSPMQGPTAGPSMRHRGRAVTHVSHAHGWIMDVWAAVLCAEKTQ